MSPASQMPRALGRALAIGAAGAALMAGVVACGDSSTPIPPRLSQATIDAALATSPPGLTKAAAALEADANTLLPGDGDGDEPGRQLDELVASLKGTAVVVNLWGEWCVPCKKEIPVFQRVALAQRGKVAFIGVATRTSREKTERFLAEDYVLPYPSVFDPSEVVNDRAGVRSIPKTLFYKPGGGEPFVHLGVYTSVEKLESDIAEYTR